MPLSGLPVNSVDKNVGIEGVFLTAHEVCPDRRAGRPDRIPASSWQGYALAPPLAHHSQPAVRSDGRQAGNRPPPSCNDDLFALFCYLDIMREVLIHLTDGNLPLHIQSLQDSISFYYCSTYYIISTGQTDTSKRLPITQQALGDLLSGFLRYAYSIDLDSLNPTDS